MEFCGATNAGMRWRDLRKVYVLKGVDITYINFAKHYEFLVKKKKVS